MTRNDLEESLQCFLPLCNDFIAEPVGEYLEARRKARLRWRGERRDMETPYLSWKLGDGHPRTLFLEDIAECLEIRVSTTHDRLLKFESRYVGL